MLLGGSLAGSVKDSSQWAVNSESQSPKQYMSVIGNVQGEEKQWHQSPQK